MPLCHSGEGRNRTGCFPYLRWNQWKCFSCDRGGDIFDLIGYVEGIDKFKDQLKRVRELFNLSTECDEFKDQRDWMFEFQCYLSFKGEREKDNYLSFYNEATKASLWNWPIFLNEGWSFQQSTDLKLAT